jgi:hypothetical protein
VISGNGNNSGNQVRMDSGHSGRFISERDRKVGPSKDNRMSSSKEKSEDRGRNY